MLKGPVAQNLSERQQKRYYHSGLDKCLNFGVHTCAYA